MWNDTIDQGATFYREVTLYSDKAKTQRLPLTDRLPRAALLDPSGAKVADMPCAVKDSGNGVVAWTMPKAATAKLKTDRVYDWFLYLDTVGEEAGQETSYPAERGKIAVNPGC